MPVQRCRPWTPSEAISGTYIGVISLYFRSEPPRADYSFNFHRIDKNCRLTW